MTTEVVEALEVNTGFQLQSPLEGFTRGADTKEMDRRNIRDDNCISYAPCSYPNSLGALLKEDNQGVLEFYLKGSGKASSKNDG